MKRNTDEAILKDPVCNMQLSPSSAIEELQYQNRTYYFCSELCQKAFIEDPEKYIPHHHQP